MKRILKFFAASIAALALVTVLVSATVSESKMASVSLSSKAYPALDCSLRAEDNGDLAVAAWKDGKEDKEN